MDELPIEEYAFIPPTHQDQWLNDLLHATVFNQFTDRLLSYRYLVLLTNNGITGPEHSEKIIGIPVERLRVDYPLNFKEQTVAYFWKNGEFGKLIPCPVVRRRFQLAHHLNDAMSKSLGQQFSRVMTNDLSKINSYYIGSLVFILMKHLILLDTTHTEVYGSNLKITPKQFEKIQQAINQRISEKIYTLELAGLIGLSEGYFYEAFKDTTGETPRQYILSTKIEWAKRLLLESEQSVIQVGMAIGFDNPANFSRMFKKFTGLSPSDFKKRYKKPNEELNND